MPRQHAGAAQDLHPKPYQTPEALESAAQACRRSRRGMLVAQGGGGGGGAGVAGAALLHEQGWCLGSTLGRRKIVTPNPTKTLKP